MERVFFLVDLCASAVFVVDVAVDLQFSETPISSTPDLLYHIVVPKSNPTLSKKGVHGQGALGATAAETAVAAIGVVPATCGVPRAFVFEWTSEKKKTNNIGALINNYTYIILEVPYYSYSIMGPKTLFYSLRPRY